jgi:type I restriction enzyme S subunit
MKTNKKQKNIPKGWAVKKFNDVIPDIWDFRGRTPLKLGLTWGHGNIPSLSANNVKRGYIDLKLDSHLGSNELYSKWMNKGDLEKNDLIFTMEAPLGHVALVPDNKKYILSQRVVAFKIDKDISNNFFMYHYLLSSIFQGKLKLIGTGSTAKGVNQKALKMLKFILPPLSEQNRIVSVLETWDSGIEKLEQKIAIKKEIKKGLMQELLAGKKRLPGFSDKWEKVQIGQVLDYEQPTNYIVDSTEYEDSYLTPVLTAGKTFILGYTNEENNIFPQENLPVIIFDDFTTANKFVDFRFKVKSSAMKILSVKDNSISDIYFVYNTIQLLKYISAEHKRTYISEYQFLDISLPSIDEQKAIKKILKNSDQEIENLEKKLEYLRDQKKYLLNNLVTGKIRTPENLNA